MDMRCLANSQRSFDREDYINDRLDELMAYYRIEEGSHRRFLETPEIRKIKVALKLCNMNVVDISDYLGEDFARVWGRKEINGGENGV